MSRIHDALRKSAESGGDPGTGTSPEQSQNGSSMHRTDVLLLDPHSRREAERVPAPTVVSPAGPPSVFPAPRFADFMSERDRGGVPREGTWAMIRRGKYRILASALAGIAAGVLFTILQHPAYKSRATLEVQNINDNFLNTKQVMPLNEGGGSGYANDIQTQIYILQSEPVINEAVKSVPPRPLKAETGWFPEARVWMQHMGIRSPRSFSEEIQRLKHSTQARALGQTRVIEISAESADPDLTADFLNKLAVAFVDQNLKARLRVSDNTADSLSELLNGAKANLEQSEAALQSYAAAVGLALTTDKKNVADEKLTQLQDELVKAETDSIRKQSRFEIAQSSVLGAMPDVLDSSSRLDYHNLLADLKRQRADLAITYTPGQTKVKRLDAQIAVIEAALNSEQTNALKRIQNEYREADRRQNLLKSEYDAQAQRVRDLGQRSIRYNVLQHQVESNRRIYDAMLQRVKDATLASAIPTSNLRVLNAAVPASVPYWPNPFANCALAASVFTFLAILSVFVRERSDPTLKTLEDGALRLGISELGVVLHDSGKTLLNVRTSKLWPGVWKKAVAPDFYRLDATAVAESLRSVATSILLNGPRQSRSCVLAVVSAGPGEGKTTVVANIGLVLASTGRRVLLVDGDVYRGSLHECFGLSNDQGLTSLLQSPTVPVEQASNYVQATFQPGLFVLSRGSSPAEHDTDVVHSQHLASVLRELQKNFDVILIDTPPLLQVAHARVFSTLADGSVLVARSGRTPMEALAAVHRRLTADKSHVLGLVLNDWEVPTRLRGYYRSYRNKFLSAQQERISLT